MSQQKSKIIEYRADYRTPDKRSNTFSKGTKRKPYIDEKLNKTQPILNPIGKNNKQKAADVGMIKISEINKKRLSIYRIFFAGITMILTVAGVVILLSAMNRTTSVISNSPTYTKYNNFIAPVVMHDPTPFTELSEVSSDLIVSSSIWRNIFQKGIENYKEFDEQGLTLIPLRDIQNAATDLFGPSATINTAEDIFGPFYSYKNGESNFHISTISNLGTFVPHIEKITEKDNELILNVSYLSREDKFFSAGNDKTDTPTPVKQMIYILQLNSETNKYYISKVENKSNN